jgi:hypothetical protein
MKTVSMEALCDSTNAEATFGDAAFYENISNYSLSVPNVMKVFLMFLGKAYTCF